MQTLNALKIPIPHVRERHEIPIEKGEAVVVVLHGETVAHIGRNHIHKAKIAMVRALADTVKHSTFKLYAKFFIIILVKGDDLLRAVRMLDEQFDLLLRHCKAEIDDVAHRRVVDLEDLIPRNEL